MPALTEIFGGELRQREGEREDAMDSRSFFFCFCFSFLVFFLFCFTLSSSEGRTEQSSSSSSSEEEEEAVLDRLRAYLRIPTVHPDPDYGPAIELLTSIASAVPELRFQTLELVPRKPLLLITWPGTDPSLPSVLLNSHMDVVPAEPSKWLHPPFSAHTDAHGNIFARGSQDMKSVGMQYLEAIRLLHASAFRPRRTLHLSFVPDEEIGGRHGMGAFVASQVFSDLRLAFVLDEGIPSPSHKYRAFYGEKAPWWFSIKSSGRPGHGSKLYDDSAAENLLASIESIMRFRKAQFDLVKAGLAAEGEVVSINPSFLKAGTPTPTGFVMNLQPSEAEAGFDMRVPPTADPVALQERIDKEWAPKSRNMTYTFQQKEPTRTEHGLPLMTATDDSNPWWKLLKDAISNGGGELDEPEIFPAATDIRYLREKGILGFGFSPITKTPVLLHDHNEFLNKEQYLKGIKIYVEIIRSFLSFDGGDRKSSADVESRAEL